MGNLLRIATGTIALRERPELAKDDKKIEQAKEDERVDSTQGCRNLQVQPVCEMAVIESKIERDKAEAERINAIFKGATIHQVWESPDIICSKVDLDATRSPKAHNLNAKTNTAAESDIDFPANEEVRLEGEPYSNLSGNEEHDPLAILRGYDAHMCKLASYRTEYKIYSDDLNKHEDDTENDKSRKRKLKEIVINGCANEVAEVNHLIPYSEKCAHFYRPLSVGVNIEDNTIILPAKKKLKQRVSVHRHHNSSSNEDDDSEKHHPSTAPMQSNEAGRSSHEEVDKVHSVLGETEATQDIKRGTTKGSVTKAKGKLVFKGKVTTLACLEEYKRHGVPWLSCCFNKCDYVKHLGSKENEKTQKVIEMLKSKGAIKPDGNIYQLNEINGIRPTSGFKNMRAHLFKCLKSNCYEGQSIEDQLPPLYKTKLPRNGNSKLLKSDGTRDFSIYSDQNKKRKKEKLQNLLKEAREAGRKEAEEQWR